MQKNFTAPIDTWALSDAQLMMERAQKRRGVFVFPVEKLFTQLQKVCVCVCVYVCVVTGPQGEEGGKGIEEERMSTFQYVFFFFFF